MLRVITSNNNTQTTQHNTTQNNTDNTTQHNTKQHRQQNTYNKDLLPSLQPVRRGGVEQKLNQRPINKRAVIVSFLNFLWLLSFFQEKESDIQCGQQNTN